MSMASRTKAPRAKARPIPFEEIERAVIAAYEAEGTGERTMYRVRSTLGLMMDGAGVWTAADLGPSTIDWFLYPGQSPTVGPFR
jgi:hypothetical protein